MVFNEFMTDMVLTELEDAVGRENCSTREIDKITHGVDYFWLSRMWADRGKIMPEADFIVSPKDAEETSKVLKIANYYKYRLPPGVAAAVHRAALFLLPAVFFLIPRE